MRIREAQPCVWWLNRGTEGRLDYYFSIQSGSFDFEVRIQTVRIVLDSLLEA